MEDSIVTQLTEWVNAWRENNGISNKKKLEGSNLEKFVSDLQNEIVKVVGDFSASADGYRNGTLVLYSGTSSRLVSDFCEASNGKYYMIDQTNASGLWKDEFRQLLI